VRDSHTRQPVRVVRRQQLPFGSPAPPTPLAPLMTWVPAAADLIAFLDAVYQVEQPRDAWIRSVLRAAMPFNRGAGIGAVLYDVSSATAMRTDFIEGVGLPDGWLDAGIDMHRNPALTAHMIATYRSQICATFSEQMIAPDLRNDVRQDYDSEYRTHAIRGHIMINGMDCSGIGCCVYLFAHKRLALHRATRALLCQVATHVATAYRLQQRLASRVHVSSAGVEAVLRPSGHIENVEGEARSRYSQHTLERAVRQRESARGTRSGDPQDVARGWRGLVAARWTLVDSYERTGHRYVLARENAPTPLGPARLSPREQQVCALAALGRSNKLIAYELGLAHSTVRVLLTRIYSKLGVTTRAALIGRLQVGEPTVQG